MNKANEDIRIALGENGIKQWELAERIGYSSFYFSAKLRKELPKEEKEKVFIAIQELIDEKEIETIECPNCKRISSGNFCPYCGTKMVKQGRNEDE